MFGLFKTKCPKCGGLEFTVIREGIFSQLMRLVIHLAFIITILFYRKKPDIYVCKSCGFSWEKR